MADIGLQQLKHLSSIAFPVRERQDIGMGAAKAVLREPVELSWMRLNSGQEILISLLSSGWMGWLGRGRAPSPRQSRRGYSQMDSLGPPSSVRGTSQIGRTSSSSSRHLQFNSHASTPGFDQSLSRWYGQTQTSSTNPCTTR